MKEQQECLPCPLPCLDHSFNPVKEDALAHNVLLLSGLTEQYGQSVCMSGVGMICQQICSMEGVSSTPM